MQHVPEALSLLITCSLNAERCFVIKERGQVGDRGEDKEARSGLRGVKGASLLRIEVNKIVPVSRIDTAALRSLQPFRRQKALMQLDA